MLYLRAAVALVAAMTFSSTALGQTRPAIAVFTAPSGPRAPALVPDATSASFSTTIARYTPPPTLILGIAEITLPPDCMDKNPGMWTNPNPSLKPVFKGTPAGTVGYQRTFMAKPQNGPCAGKGPFTFRAIDFSWMAHYNQTGLGPDVAPPPCATTNPVCPTAVFQGEWTTPDGMFDIVYSFEVSVDVVRPKGETSFTDGWAGSRANWTQRLLPPDSDPSFSFANEQVKEHLIFGTNPLTGDMFSSNCASRAPTALGQPTPGKGLPVSTDAPPWTVNANNQWGPDQVGNDPCAVEAYRCAGANFQPFTKETTFTCGYMLPQQMSIKSPADSGFNYVYSNNLLGGGMGLAIKLANVGGGPAGQFWGLVQSQRDTREFGSQVRDVEGFYTNTSSCPGYIDLSKC